MTAGSVRIVRLCQSDSVRAGCVRAGFVTATVEDSVRADESSLCGSRLKQAVCRVYERTV